MAVAKAYPEPEKGGKRTKGELGAFSILALVCADIARRRL
jgi:hypothetical protein